MKIKISIINSLWLLLGLLSMTMSGCNKYLDKPLPAGTIAVNNVYVSDNSVSSVVTGCLLSIPSSGPFQGSRSSNLGLVSGLYTDELSNPEGNSANVPFYMDAIQSTNISVWSTNYTKIFAVNSAIEGINSTGATLYFKNQWLGECYFLRAFYYFYLTNLYGDVPLALTSDYAANNVLSRAPQSQVYQQIIADLKLAQSLLNSGYTDGYGASTGDRVRPNRYAATALLAKAYLYDQKWDSAEVQADSVIANTSLYKLEALSKVFAGSSNETVWALVPNTGSLAYEYNFYNNGMPATITYPKNLGSSSVYTAMNTPLLNAFEAGDGRYTNWVRSSTISAHDTVPAKTYYFPNKYSSSVLGSQFDVVLRLGELYLIRAEARAHQSGRLTDAIPDLNAIRARAGLPPTTAMTQGDLFGAIAHERQIELFSECANRYFDLKRTGAIDSVMAVVAPMKSTTWSSYMSLMPIPPTDLIQDPNLTANPGYLQ